MTLVVRGSGRPVSSGGSGCSAARRLSSRYFCREQLATTVYSQVEKRLRPSEVADVPRHLHQDVLRGLLGVLPVQQEPAATPHHVGADQAQERVQCGGVASGCADGQVLGLLGRRCPPRLLCAHTGII